MTPAPTSDHFRLLVEGVRDYGIFMLDPTGHIMSWNVGAGLIKGYRSDEIIGQHFSKFYEQEAIDRGWPAYELERAAIDGRFEDESWRIRRDGSRFWAQVVITAVRATDGTLIGFSKVTRDLTERRRQEDALRQSEERFRLLVDGVKDYAIIMLDADGKVQTWNAGAELIKGYKSEEILGQHFSVFYPADAIDRGWPAHELSVAGTLGRFEDEGWRLRRDGSRFWASVIITGLRDRDGRLAGFAKVTRDITDRQRLEALVQSTREMTEFLAMLSHELRNPLAPIRNAVAVLEVHDTNDPTIKWSREVIGRQSAHMSRLIEDLLDVSRITSGKIVLTLVPIDIRTVVAIAIESALPQTAERKHVLNVSLPEHPVMVNGDATRITQVVTNLVSNAIKYTPVGGHITASLQVVNRNVLLHVSDSGIGLRANQLERVFDLFAQGERSLARSEGGLGVGLTLVRRLVELHGGTAVASSAGPGLGSTFEVCLPLLEWSAPSPVPPVSPGAPPASGNLRRRILVVDDNVDSANSMTALLSFKGHDVHAALDGASAMKELSLFAPQLVLLDLGLPGMDGYDVLREIRGDAAYEGMVVCAMTGYGQNDDRRRTRDAGFDHHFVKPVNLVALDEVITSLPDLVKV
ncbi:MAG: PAS domain S-box protein [Phycisphaerae bacterium]|nr:PAS domain S-box protein [Gemmatimonadaceae bacterium]